MSRKKLALDPGTVAIVFYVDTTSDDPCDWDVRVTCPEHYDDLMSRLRTEGKTYDDLECATGLYHTGAENMVHCAVCGELISKRH